MIREGREEMARRIPIQNGYECLTTVPICRMLAMDEWKKSTVPSFLTAFDINCIFALSHILTLHASSNFKFLSKKRSTGNVLALLVDLERARLVPRNPFAETVLPLHP